MSGSHISIPPDQHHRPRLIRQTVLPQAAGMRAESIESAKPTELRANISPHRPATRAEEGDLGNVRDIMSGTSSDTTPNVPPILVADVPGADVSSGADGLPPRSALSLRQRLVVDAS